MIHFHWDSEFIQVMPTFVAGLSGKTSVGNPRWEILGNTVREIRDCPVNTGKYRKTLLNGYFFPIKESYEVKIYIKFNTYTKKQGLGI